MLVDLCHIVLFMMVSQTRLSVNMLLLHIILKFSSLNDTFNITAYCKNWFSTTLLIFTKSLELYSRLGLVFEQVNGNSPIIIVCYRHVAFGSVIASWFDWIDQVNVDKFAFPGCSGSLAKRLMFGECTAARIACRLFELGVK